MRGSLPAARRVASMASAIRASGVCRSHPDAARRAANACRHAIFTRMNTLSTRLRKILERQPGIRQALLFGSVASGLAHPDSDLDLAVEAEQPLTADDKMRLIADLAVAIGRPVDLVDLKTVGEPLLGQILKNGVRILGSTSDHAALIYRHLLDNADFQPCVNRILRERRQAWIG